MTKLERSWARWFPIFTGKHLAQHKRKVLQHRRYDQLKLEHIASTLHRIEHILYEVFLKILLACTCERHSPLPLPSQHCVSMLHRFSFKHKCALVFQAILPSITTLLHFAFLSEMFTLFLGVSHPLRESRVPYTIPQETESHSYWSTLAVTRVTV